MTEWFQQLRTIYLVLDDRHRQALWNRFIKYIYPTNNGDAIQNWRILQNLKQRRLRPGRSWKTVLRFILRGMVLGHCDMNILLNLFFLHFPLTRKVQPWYPGLKCKQKYSKPDHSAVQVGFYRTLTKPVLDLYQRSPRIIAFPFIP